MEQDMAHRTCVIIWVCFRVHGTWVTGGAASKEDMIWAIIKVVGFIFGLLAVAVVLESFNGFVLDNMWVK